MSSPIERFQKKSSYQQVTLVCPQEAQRVQKAAKVAKAVALLAQVCH
jgi:hypothetical protein